jgi:hypothetical protein
LRKWLQRGVRAKDSAGPTLEELRSVRNTADYLADAIKAAPDGQLGPDDIEKLKGFGANLEVLTDKLKKSKR